MQYTLPGFSTPLLIRKTENDFDNRKRPHDEFLYDIQNYLDSKSYTHRPDVYESDPELAKILKSIDTETANEILKGPDLFVAHRDLHTFKLDAKVNPNQNWRTLRINTEVYKVYRNLVMKNPDCDILIAYRDIHKRRSQMDKSYFEAGFWMSNPPDFEIHIPQEKWNDRLIRYDIDKSFPDKVAEPTPNGNGSNNPYISISEAIVNNLADWKELIERRTNIFMQKKSYAQF